ncbi:universal stress protein family domain protein [Talaromyces stipitatus ATCC 10500]|uniref:Universal stress protein family domain protein n=1 Tax=Talaromyces stipitatus (strain ATCC 10500 / CBS 375.48 / QM 6759 / NRRL 1006) TaxID=441959 RepID=B8M3M1_TALSN|nr:universal stress protein family domain protein [Talaromyces stipitatus ATCC 10500]EED22393.1 universal stress protein family domain protein [Talaromyces stipitatus ATCC 10500]
MFGKDKDQKRPLKMSLEQTLEQERKELLRNLDGLKGPRAPSRIASNRGKTLIPLRNSSRQEKTESGRRASVSSPLASSSPWTNTLLSEWDDSIYEPSDDAEEPEPERRSSDSVTQLKREKEKKQKALEEREIDIDAGFLYGMQSSVPHIVLPQKHSAPAALELSPRYRTPAQSQTQSHPHSQSQLQSNAVPSPKSRRFSLKKHRLSTSSMDNDAPDTVSEASTSPTLSKASLHDPDRSGRLTKDRTESADENSDSADSSDEEDDTSSEEEDLYDIRKGPVGPRGRSKSPRGRSKTKTGLSPGTSPARSPAPPGGWSGKRGPGPRPQGSPSVGGALGLFNELQEEEELNGPIVTHRRANGRRTVLSPGPRRSGVHPHTSFDHNGSGLNTPVGSDEEADLSDIKQAQNLSIHLSSVDTSIPDRAIRTIIRGDFPRLQQEAEEGFRRQRKYLVATDLSEESVYALEWTIGTILRDGDTLFAVYAVADENASGVDLNTGVQIGDGATAIRRTTDIVGKQTEKTAMKYQAASSTSLLPNALAAYFGGTDSKANSRTNSVDSRALSRSEQERLRAIEDISNTCVRLLRKTMLQVRVAVEVIHCKSPKHLLTEAIDGLEPTLVVLGSRGRSALKGVLLGSFSNYLVTKSSVPVMVARKKLKKHTKNTRRIRLSNNLTTPRGLAGAKID